jgi:hypothetical protein
VGNAGVILIQGTGFTPNDLLVQSGKNGNIYLLNMAATKMGGYSGTTGSFVCSPLPVTTGTDNVVSTFLGDTSVNPNGLCYDTTQECGTQGSPVFWNKNIYFGPRCQPVKQIALQATTGTYNVKLGYVSATTQGGQTSTACHSPTTPVFPYPGAQMAISQYRNGSQPAAILWALDNSQYAHAPPLPPVLYAYDASNIAAAALFSANAGTGGAVKFAVPTVANGRVYVGNSNQLVVFH